MVPDSVDDACPSPSLNPLSAGYLLALLLKMCRGSLKSLTDSENGPLMALLAILGLVAHSPTLLMLPGYPVWARACLCTLPATENLSKGLAAVQILPADCGGAKEAEVKESQPLANLGSEANMNPGHLVWVGGCRRTLSATICLSRGLAAV